MDSDVINKTEDEFSKVFLDSEGSQIYCVCQPTMHLPSDLAAWLFCQLASSFQHRKRFISIFFPTNNLPESMKTSEQQIIYVILKQKEYPFLDLLGNRLVNSYVQVRCEMETALSWLSTLGGAFSALGDISQDWATEAGLISAKQLKIAIKLDDPLIASRCRLYAAISFMQKGYLKKSRELVQREYKYALSLPEGQDPKLQRMCLGVWAKLQHIWKQNHKNKSTKLSGCSSSDTSNSSNNLQVYYCKKDYGKMIVNGI